MVESFRIYYPTSAAGKKQWNSRYGLNAYWAGKHWSKRKEDAEYWHLLTRSAMNKEGVRKHPFEKPVEIALLWNDKLDIDNHAAMGKMIVDAMKGRLINDDNRKWVKAVYHSFHDEDYILVQVREIESGG